MEATVAEDSQLVRRFNPLRCVRRGLRAACRWTIRLGCGRSSLSSGVRGRRVGRVRAPHLASLSAAMLEPVEIQDIVDQSAVASTIGHQHLPPVVSGAVQLMGTAEPSSPGTLFPLVLRRPSYDISTHVSSHGHQRRSVQYHLHADGSNVYSHNHHYQHHPHRRHQYPDQSQLHQLDEALSMYQSADIHLSRPCNCDRAITGLGCNGHCAVVTDAHRDTASTTQTTNMGIAGSCTCNGSNTAEALRQPSEDDVPSQGYSLQHLLAVGSRQWGNGSWWDGRGLLRVKIYDFAIYADPVKAAHVLRKKDAAASPKRRALGSSIDGIASSGGGSPTELLVSPASRVDMSLTIRACRNLPLQLLSQEFERILQRRHEKAGGRADDPALQELLSYFSREKLPEHVVTATSPASSSLSGGDAVRKGASITFSRSSSGTLMTEAGGRVLGMVESPPLAEALFDLYLGDQPVSKRAKATAGAALLEIATREGPTDYRYQVQPGQQLVCRPGTWDVEACSLQVP